jgi:glyoxylate reductase
MARAIDILITRALPEDMVAPLRERWHVVQGPGRAFMPPSELRRLIGGARVAVATGVDRFDESMLSKAIRLRLVALVGAGHDNVDLDAAARRGIWVTNTPDVVTEATADIAFLLILGVLRRASEAIEFVKRGAWTRIDPDAFVGTDPRGLTIGILGMGRIGQALARRIRPIGMHVSYHSRRRLAPVTESELGVSWTSFDDLIGGSDVISIHLPLSPSTRGIIDEAVMARMRPGAFLVNTARGALVDEEALIRHLRSGQLSGVGLDVFAHEPRVPRALREHPKALLLPHIGSATATTRRAMVELSLRNAEEVLMGRPPVTPVNRPADGA